MQHLNILQKEKYSQEYAAGKSLIDRAAGRFYTHELIGRHLVSAISRTHIPRRSSRIRMVEPFCGDGRLVCWMLEEAGRSKSLKRNLWEIDIWDCDEDILRVAEERIRHSAGKSGVDARVRPICGDAFQIAPQYFGRFDVCLTNPPWELLKPDRRELDRLTEKDAAQYVALLRKRDSALMDLYPLSKPLRKFSGWGTNLARCGTEAAIRLTAPNGICGIVSPASLLADQMSVNLRNWIFAKHSVLDIAYYVAEARLFDTVDQPSITIVIKNSMSNGPVPYLSVYNREHRKECLRLSANDWERIRENDYILPLQFGLDLIPLHNKWRQFPRFRDLESEDPDGLWAGRELDETGHQNFLAQRGKYLFII